MSVLVSAPGRASSALPNEATWDPLTQPFAESDTLLIPDLTSYQTINAQGGILLDPADYVPQATTAAKYDFGAGKFTGAIKPKSTGRYVYFPVNGLAGSDEFTIECWAMHPALDWGNAGCSGIIFGIDTPTLEALFELNAGQLYARSTVLTAAPTTRNSSTTIQALGAFSLTAGAFHHVAMTLKAGTLRFYFNGVQRASRTGLVPVGVVSDTSLGGGVIFGGSPAAAGGFWVSDARVSRTARTPSVVVARRSLTGDLAVDTASNAGSVTPGFLGALHPPMHLDSGVPRTTSPALVAAAIKTIRTDKMLSATPSKAGGTDATHPTLGQSGLYSYDWQVVDRTMDLLASYGAEAYIGVDAAPQILGGGAPYTGAALTTLTSGNADFSGTPPNNTAAWVHMVKDLVHYITVTRGDTVQRWGVWNEPDINSWTGTRPEWMDFYVVTANAIRTIDATTPIGGPEISEIGTTNAKLWINDLFAKVAANPGCPLDFIAYHEYTGDVANIDNARAIVDDYAVLHGFATGLPIIASEMNWNITTLYRTDFLDRTIWTRGLWTLRALGAAFQSALIVRALATTGFAGVVALSTSFGNPYEEGFFACEALGPDDEQWATYNMMKGWQLTLGNRKLTMVQDLPPGIHAYAGTNTVTGRVGVVVASTGWANRTARTVNLHLTGMTGTKRLRRYLVDETHSSPWDGLSDADRVAQVIPASQDLELIEDRTASAAALRDIQVTVPRWSTQFLLLDAA